MTKSCHRRSIHFMGIPRVIRYVDSMRIDTLWIDPMGQLNGCSDYDCMFMLSGCVDEFKLCGLPHWFGLFLFLGNYAEDVMA